MTRLFLGGCLAVTLTIVAPLHAGAEEAAPEMTPEQQAEMEAYIQAGTPGPEHRMLTKGAGDYTCAVKNWFDPDQPPLEEKGTATRTVEFDGRVVVERYSGMMMGSPFTGQSMNGFDNVSRKYWSTWVDSMSTGMMVSEGTCDENGSCTFEGSWNDPIKKGPVKARMKSRWTSPTTQVFEMYGPGKDGKEMKMMEITYTRR